MIIVLGDDETECWLVHFTFTKMLKFCLNYPIIELCGFPLPSDPRQALSILRIKIREITYGDTSRGDIIWFKRPRTLATMDCLFYWGHFTSYSFTLLNGEYENESNITTSVGWHQRVNGHDIQKSGLGFSIDLETMYCSRDNFFFLLRKPSYFSFCQNLKTAQSSSWNEDSLEIWSFVLG